MPTPFEIEKLLDWLKTFPMDVVVKAIEEAVSQNERKIKYIEGILKNWQKKGLLTLSLVESHIKDWESKKQNKTATQPRTKTPKNRFINYKQRERDYEQLEKMERAYLEREIAERKAKDEASIPS
jgi:DnaD/phage-associated family protein